MYLIRQVATGLIVGCGLLIAAPTVAAQQFKPCGLITDAAAARALGGFAQGTSLPNLPPGIDACHFVDVDGNDVSVSRESNVFAPGTPVQAGDLAQNAFSNVTNDLAAQINALTGPGMKINVPGLEITIVGGVGDTALFIKEQAPGSANDNLVVRSGTDMFEFDADDSPDIPGRLVDLAKAVLSNVAQPTP